MKYCPECGIAIQVPNAKFCTECGTSFGLAQNITSGQASAVIPKDFLESHQLANGKADEIQIESSEVGDNSPYVYTLGTKLEDFVEQILLKQGYTSTVKRQKLRGASQALSEIDVLARKDGKLTAFECKNYNEARMVGIKELRDFQSKIQDLPQIDDGIFITNARFSSEAERYSKHNGLVLWDGEKLSRIQYLMNIGRFETSDRDIELPAALPVVMSYDEFAKISLVNPLLLTLINSKLTFMPYFLVTYSIKKSKSMFNFGNKKQALQLSSELEKLIASSIIVKTVNTWKDLTHTSTDNESTSTSNNYHHDLHIVDAISGEILRYSVIKEDETNILIKIKTNKPKEDVLKINENNQNFIDLNTIQPVMNYKMKQTGEYTLEIKQPHIHQSAAERIVMEQVVEESKSRHQEVVINGSLLIFVPVWSTTIQSKDGYYSRLALAASKKILHDELEFCPKDYTSLRLRKSEVRKTFAACEHCGKVLCRKHILVADGRYVCSEHDKPTESIDTTSKNSKFNSIASKMRLKASSLYNTDSITSIGSRISQISNPRVIRNASSSKPLSSSSSNDGQQAPTTTKKDTKLSIFNLDSSSQASNDLNERQETFVDEFHEKSFPSKKITRYTSDGRPSQT